MKLAYFEFEKNTSFNLKSVYSTYQTSHKQNKNCRTIYTIYLCLVLGHHKTGRSSSQQNPEAQSSYKCVTKRLALRMILCEVPVICQATQAKQWQQLI